MKTPGVTYSGCIAPGWMYCTRVDVLHQGTDMNPHNTCSQIHPRSHWCWVPVSQYRYLHMWQQPPIQWHSNPSPDPSVPSHLQAFTYTHITCSYQLLRLIRHKQITSLVLQITSPVLQITSNQKRKRNLCE